MRRVRRARRPLIALVALALALAVGYAVRAADTGPDHPPPSTTTRQVPATSGTVALSALPRQASITVARIRAGGPFPYPHNDGGVFHNNEHHLPAKPDGYYREYTVPTPDSPDRGARRLIVGRAGDYWYTGDHYDSFRRVDVHR